MAFRGCTCRCILRGCTCLKCTNQAEVHTQGVLLSQVHQPSRNAYLGGALVSARLCRLPEQEVHQPSKKCTNRTECVVSLVGAVETTAPPCSNCTPLRDACIPLMDICSRNVKDVNIIKTKYLIYIFFTKNVYFCRTNGSVLTILSIL